MSRGSTVRHIQFKTLTAGGSAAKTKVNMKLQDKPSGCVIWIVVTPGLDLQSFLWFGGAPGQPLPDISSLRTAKHTRGNKDGKKVKRPNHREVPIGRFEKLHTLDEVLTRLFG